MKFSFALKTLLVILSLTNSVFSFSQFLIYDINNSGLPYNTVRCVSIDQNDNVWAGTDFGLAMFDGTNWTVYNTSNSGLTDNQIRSIEFDSNNELWVGTLFGGIFHYDGAIWTNYNASNSGLPDNQVKDIEFDQDGFLWAATTGGLAMYNFSSWTVWNVFNSTLPTNNISCIEIANNNEKHIGAVNGGLQIISADNLNITTYWTYNSSLLDNTILKVDFDPLNLLWMATPSGGLIVHYTGDNWVYYNEETSTIPTTSVTYILVDGNIKYAPTLDNGLVIFDGINFSSYNMSNSNLPDNYLFCIEKDSQGNFWMGSYNGGLIKFNPATIGINEQSSSFFHLENMLSSGNNFLFQFNVPVKNATVYNINGQVVFSQNYSTSVLEIEKPKTAGLYIFDFISENGEKITSKLFIY